MRRRFGSRSGQAMVEYALLYAGVILPLTFMTIFVAEMLWVWHSVLDFTRDGARYAATHCWQSDGANVTNYMQSHVPRMIDMDQFQSGAAGLTVQYFTIDPDTGSMSDYSCQNSECSVDCVPDAVSVSISNYQFTRFSSYMRLPAVTIPTFRTSLPMESAGCDEAGSCLP
jgi:Flp pilus assembly protein TadG